MESTVKIFSCKASIYLADRIATCYGTSLGDVEVNSFSDGELSVHFNESVRGCDVFIVQSTFPPAENIIELLLMIDAAKRASARKVNVVMPYFGYARQDRKDKPRVAIGGKMIANTLTAAGADRIMTMDLHADQIQGFFDIPLDHFSGASVFAPYIKDLGLENLVFASPDVGGVKRARGFAKHFGVDLVMCDKHREKANQIATMHLIGDVTGADVVLVDDMIDTGGTLAKAADLIMKEGARSVRAICTHPVLSGEAYETIENSALEELVVTNSLPLKKETKKIVQLGLGDLFAEAIKKVHGFESISGLFI